MTPPFPGDWRPVAPTLAQIEARSGAWWWHWSRGWPPSADRLGTGDDGEGTEAFVYDGEGTRYSAATWDEDGRSEWFGQLGTLVCPCDANGATVPWPEEG